MFNKLQESQNRSLDELAATRYDLTVTMKEQKRLSEIIKQKDDELIRLREQLAISRKCFSAARVKSLPLDNQKPEAFLFLGI